ncbi:hypothetical protein GCM10023154_09970 [Advenella faeciporci]|uniref:hypothetical protein n=1 Tax=Advenella faeciporci TaxID=797535 RepID=UPI001672DCA5|nr:hypothetical protein [Advenella faeciporci]
MAASKIKTKKAKNLAVPLNKPSASAFLLVGFGGISFFMAESAVLIFEETEGVIVALILDSTFEFCKKHGGFLKNRHVFQTRLAN